MFAENHKLASQITIRLLRAEDSAVLREINEQTPQAANWTSVSYEQVTQETGGLGLVSECDGTIRGFLVARRVLDQGEILNLAIREEFRRCGDGSALLSRAVAEFHCSGVNKTFLEVRASNGPALSFYSKHGFAIVGHRKNYYRDTGEDAVLMEKNLTT